MYVAYNRHGDMIADHHDYDTLVHELSVAGYSPMDYFIGKA